MAKAEAASTIREWMEQFMDAACKGRVKETSGGAGPGQDYAYLHYCTEDGEHSALVLRATIVDGAAEVRAIEVNAGPEDIRDHLDEATHGQTPLGP